MKAKLGIYIPMFGGWIRKTPVEEPEISFRYALKVALAAEEFGIHSIWISDHLLNPIKGENTPSLEAWTTLTGIAALTKKIELFHGALCQGFRYPSVLAKMCSTLSDLSGYRFKLCLGAGWYKREFEAYGIPWNSHDIRIEKAREQIEIIRKFWSESSFDYQGRFYKIKRGVMKPKPKKPIEIWWAGESEKSKELVADLADGWLVHSSTLNEAQTKIEDMNKRLKKKGKDKIKYAIPLRVFVARTKKKAKEKMRVLAEFKASFIQEILSTGLIGTPEHVAEKVKEFNNIGFDYLIFRVSPTLEQLELIGDHVIPLLH